MRLPLYQIDAFTNRPFSGNPAAVLPLQAWLPDETLQSIALENNLSETVFFVLEENGYRIRWFTPKVEVDLCGHATLAAGFVLMTELRPELQQVRFQSRSGELVVMRARDRFTLDFPSRPPEKLDALEGLEAALGLKPLELWKSRDVMAVLDSEATVRGLKPDHSLLAKLPMWSLIVTAPGENVDFVSRFFGPAQGIEEDPVTGSSHCTLIPYWAERLGKQKLHALQVSARGGELWCELAGDRVKISGQAVKVVEGAFWL